MAQFVFWVMGQRVGPEPNKAWEYVAGPFNSFLLADAHVVAHMREWCDFCVFNIQAVQLGAKKVYGPLLIKSVKLN